MKVILGIDTARGWAICKHDGSYRLILEAGTVAGLPEMLRRIKELHKEYNGKIDIVRIEKPTSRKVFQRGNAQSRFAMQKIAVNVGENMAKADAIYEFCIALGMTAERRPPIKGMTKLSASRVWQLTGYEGRTSEHARDAIMISWI